MNNSLAELALEYLESAKKIDEIIRTTREEKRRAKEQCDFLASRKIASKLLVLYSEKRELIDTAQLLGNYYTDSSSECAVCNA